MAKKIPFTPASIDAFCGRILDDPLTPGLAIELLPSGKKRWRYRRRIAGWKTIATVFGGLFPTQTIAAAREWVRELSDQVEAGIDPREVRREEKARTEMTVGKAHELYMAAVREGRASRAKRKNKPRTIADKLEICERDIAPKLGSQSVYEITERDLIRLVTAKGKVAKVRANRLAAELKVFFGWAASLRGLEVGLETDPSRRLGDLKFPETPRQRKLSLEEIEWFLKAVAEEEREFRRGMLLWLLTAARISEVCQARRTELVDGIWTIPANDAEGRAESARLAQKEAGPGNPAEFHFDGGDMETYTEMVLAMDRNIGRLLRRLSELGMEDDTVVVFTSDNGGERFSDTWPFTGVKTELLEGGIRVPCIVKWPGVTLAGSENDWPVVSIDFMPTFLTAAGGAPNPALPSDGVDIRPALMGGSPPDRTLYWRFSHKDQKAVRRGPHKYLSINGNEFLFDVVADPLERANLKARMPDKFAELKAAFSEWNAGMLSDPDASTHGFSPEELADHFGLDS